MITLLMLSVVTITAVAFLAVSRRERVAVSTSGEQLDARYIANVGLNHAQGRLASRISAFTNRAAYGGYMVSTNYGNPYFQQGVNYAYLQTRNFRHLTNVSYYANSNFTKFNLENAGDRESYARLLGNLYYDPRPPVFVSTNRNPRLPPDFRFYLDLNRNGQFETNGFIWERDRQGRIIGNSQRFFWGDPEWIGVLENPDVPHSGTNRFLGRFAYVVVPTSRTLDVNYIGNDAKRLDVGAGLPRDTNVLLSSGFLRNQGVGSWEVNLAGFFGTLNTNVWLYSINDYRYETNIAVRSQGLTFSDAERVRRFRQGPTAPQSADDFYLIDSGASDLVQVNNTFQGDFIDGYSDGPLVTTVAQIRGRVPDNDRPNLAWAGSDLTNHFTGLNDWFNPTLGFGARITGQYTNQSVARTSPLSTYDRYTFYRLISQLGTDSADGRFESGTHPVYSDVYRGVDSVNPNGFYRRAKLNLNYAQDNVESSSIDSARVTSFQPWKPLQWFTNAASRLLLSEFTNSLPFFPPGQARSVPGLPIHGSVRVRDANNLEYLTNYVYDSQVHRLLQVAANIYDATTNQLLLPLQGPVNQRVAFPTVLRPLVYEDARTPGVLRLHSFEQIGAVPNLNNPLEFLLARDWVSPDLVTNGAPHSGGSPRQRLAPSLPEEDVTSAKRGFNVFGLPWVVGAKKGLPNFNQALWQTVFQPTRRLIITRPTRNSKIGNSELPFAGANSGGFRTEYQYILSFTNLVGIEAWNSYLTNFTRPVRIFATNVLEFTLRDETLPQNPQVLVERRELLSLDLTTNNWAAKQYLSGGFSRNTNSPQYLAYPPQIPANVQTVRNGIYPNGLAIGLSFIYDPIRRLALPLTQTNEARVAISQSNRRYLNPVVSAYATNQLFFTIIDNLSGRLLDVVTLRSVMVRTNLISTLSFDSQGAEQEFFQEQLTGPPDAQMPAFWSTNLVQNNRTRGMDNQMLASLGVFRVPPSLWRSPAGAGGLVEDPQFSIDGLRYFLYGTLPTTSLDPSYADRIRRQYGSNLVVQVGFNPSPKVFMSDRRMANDPLVHYTRDDLGPGYFFLTEAGYTEIPHEFFGLVSGADFGGIQLATNFVGFDIGRSSKYINLYAPWGANPNYTGVAVGVDDRDSRAFDYGFKDPLIRSPDDWNFPTGTNSQFRFGSIGELGRVHRGTPWQTIYLKSPPAPELNPGEPSLMTRLSGAPLTWAGWAGNRRTNPTNDWKLMDLFTTAYNDNAARGQLGVNQAGYSAWSALLSSVPLLRNTVNVDDPQLVFLEPSSPEVLEVLTGYTDRQGRLVPGLIAMMGATNSSGVLINPNGVFPNLGSILQVPTLSDRAPFIRTDVNWSAIRNVSDEVLERLPQQVLSLMRADEPRFVIYAYGQTLKPAPNAVNLRPGPLYGITTNYAITGEYVTKTVLRLDGDPRRLQPVIEDQRVILSNP